MRLDVFLKLSRIIGRRSLAQEFCDAKLVAVNGSPARSSKTVTAGDEISVRRHDRLTRFRVLEIPPRKQVSKEDAASLFSVISDEPAVDF